MIIGAIYGFVLAVGIGIGVVVFKEVGDAIERRFGTHIAIIYGLTVVGAIVGAIVGYNYPMTIL